MNIANFFYERMATSIPATDLLFVFGPPLFNKNCYLPKSLLKQDCVHLNLSKLFEDNPSFGLRDASLQIISELKKDKQVIIEDGLRLSTSRKSILSTVKRKVPGCKALLVKIIPDHGLLQVLWTHQNRHGSDLLPNCSCQSENTSAVRWFDASFLSVDYLSGYVDAPHENEGFAIEEVQAPFQLQSSFKCDVPALFIQWEVVISDMEDTSNALSMICRRWTSLNDHGRIILISDGRTDFKSVSKETSEIHQYLNQLYMKINEPIFIVKAANASHMNSFCIPPQPGLLAFVQTRYFIDLQQSVYIIETTDHMKMAQAAGVRFVKSSKAFRYPEKVLNSLCIIPPVPAMLRDVSLVKDEEFTTSVSPSLPLLDQCLEDNCGFVSKSHSNGVEEFVFIPDVTSISNLQESFANVMTPTNMPGSRRATREAAVLTAESTTCMSTIASSSKVKDKPIDYKRDNSNPSLPAWMANRRLSRKSTESSLSGVESDELDASFKFVKTVYLMSEKELKDMAIQIMKQAGKTVPGEIKQHTSDGTDHPG